jgi:hypothetical protein
MSAPDDLLYRFALPIHGAMRSFDDPLYALDLFRVVPQEHRAEVLLLLIALAVGAADPAVLSSVQAVLALPLHRDEEPVAPRPLIAPPGYEELVGERFGPVARRSAP